MKHENSLLQEEVNKGIELFNKNKFDEAIKIFDLLKEKNDTKIISLFFLGLIQTKKKNPKLAKENFFQILKIDQDHEDTNLSLSLLYLEEKDFNNSLIYLKKVLIINKKNFNALYHLGLVQFYLRNLDESLDFFNKCIVANKDHFQSYLMLGHIYLRKKEFDKAVNSYKKVLELNPDRERTKFNLSWCYFALLKFEEAFEYYEFRKEKMTPKGRYLEVISKFKSNEWSGQNLDNKTILIICEQGYGDNINFFRYLFWLNDKYKVKIIFYSHEKLEHLFKNSPFQIISNLNSINHIDYYQHLLSLPGIYYKESKKFKKNINFISVNEEIDSKWEKKLSVFKKPIIALNWQGDSRYSHDDMRSIPLSYFKDVLNDKNFNFISLQKNFGSEQIKSNNFENLLMDLSNEIDLGQNAFEDTISILKKVDYIITSDTAIAHLAGTLDVKTYLLLSYNPEWRWHIELKYKYFYQNINIIQQENFNDWSGVFKKLKDELRVNNLLD